VPSNDPNYLKRVLDAGVEGVMVPNVETAEDARAVVAACRYPPAGRRGSALGSARASDYGIRAADYRISAADELLIVRQTESPTSRSSAVFTINSLPPALDARFIDKLLHAEPATIGHFRNWGFMDPAIRAMQPDVRIAGPAVTVRAPGIDGTIVGYALGQVRHGDVLVIDRCGDHRHAAFGGLVAYACKVAGLAGVIIDGMATDIGEVRKYGVPLWCRGLSAVTTKRIGLAGEFCVPVSCGGVDVR